MVVLGGPKYRGRRTGDVPSGVYTEQMEQPDKSVAHQCNPSALRSGAEKGDLNLFITQDLCVMKDGVPCRLADSGTIILNVINNADPTSGVGFDFIPIKEGACGISTEIAISMNG